MPYPSNIYIYPSYACVYIHIDMLAMSIKSMPLILVSTFLVSSQSNSASLFALAKRRSRRGHHSMHQLIYEPMAACNEELAAPIELSGPQRGYKATARYAVQYQEGAQGQCTHARPCNINRGCNTHQQLIVSHMGLRLRGGVVYSRVPG